ncbi:MFS transporter [Priestia endophytica]|uniref:MFS transporter n=1 Tax=Priestia endophytica TaxID=135735 RepID=UPI002040017B|nr:MFS transporter [Priestia endophytica]MCM3538050.1 MFS transporter [Priestia endophytica]
MKKEWNMLNLLLVNLGITGVGSWVYFIALNLIVLEQTYSAFAVTVLYLLKASAALLANIWAGSLVDRARTKQLMIFLQLIQAGLIVLLPLCNTILMLYVFVFFINIASAMYQPTVLSYTTKLVAQEYRKTFNSYKSLLDSGAFITGPALAGLFMMKEAGDLAIYLNGAALLLAALLTLLLPDVEEEREKQDSLSFAMFKKDVALVGRFSAAFPYVAFISLLFHLMMVLMTATDSLEAAFATTVIGLTEGEYGVIVSGAGGGILVGSFVNAWLIHHLSLLRLMSIGAIITSLGYLLFSFSNMFASAFVGCFTLSFALAFLNAGFLTFYQNSVPVHLIGRMSSMLTFIESLLVLFFTVCFGWLAEMFSIRLLVVIGACSMALLAIVFGGVNFQAVRAQFYLNRERKEKNSASKPL